MKTMKKDLEIVRVKENQVKAHQQQGWKFCPKSEWKEIRDA